MSLGDHQNHRLRQSEQSQQIRNGSAVLPRGISNLLMSKLKFLGETLIAAGRVDRVEVAPLKIFDEGQHEARSVVEILDQRWNFRPSKIRRRAKTSFTRDELVRVSRAANRNGLQEAARGQRCL